MATLVENIVSLENEADSIVAQARGEARELERLSIAEAEAYRRKLVEETDQRVSAFQKEMEERHKVSVVDTEKELAQTLSSIDQLPDGRLRDQIEKIVTKFRES